MWPLRTACQIIEELRKCNETRNFSYFLSLLEELQSAANRMESAIEGKHDLIELDKERRELHKKVKKLREYVDRKAKTIGFKANDSEEE